MARKNFWVSLVIVGLLSGPALAEPTVGIKNSPHDLSSAATHSGFKATNVDELCVFCHTPHQASTDTTNAPLWNRTASGVLNVENLYTSGSLSDDSLPAAVSSAVDASDARLCLSCHDGSSMAAGLVVPPTTTDGEAIAFEGTNTISGRGKIAGADTNALKDDHPIGMNYAAILAGDKKDGFNADIAPLRLFSFTPVEGDAQQVMWCASCHSVHDNQHGSFLAMSNAQSALCLKCHKK